MSFLEPEWKPFETWIERQQRIVWRRQLLVSAQVAAVTLAALFAVVQIIAAVVG